MRTYDDWYPGHLKDLDEEECRDLVSQHLIGRVAWCHPTDGPTVLPVNYRFDGRHIVFRTSPHTDLARHFTQGRATFQIDELDEYTQSGWSVMARGRAELVPWDEVSGARPAVESLGCRQPELLRAHRCRETHRPTSAPRLTTDGRLSNR
jgi:uncharacterized protein